MPRRKRVHSENEAGSNGNGKGNGVRRACYFITDKVATGGKTQRGNKEYVDMEVYAHGDLLRCLSFLRQIHSDDAKLFRRAGYGEGGGIDPAAKEDVLLARKKMTEQEKVEIKQAFGAKALQRDQQRRQESTVIGKKKRGRPPKKKLVDVTAEDDEEALDNRRGHLPMLFDEVEEG